MTEQNEELSLTPEEKVGVNELAEKLEEPRAVRLLAEWVAIDHDETRLQYEKYMTAAQELYEYITVGIRMCHQSQIAKARPIIEKQGGKRITKNKPPLLSEMELYHFSGGSYANFALNQRSYFERVAQAQREADIKFYRG